MTLNAPTNFYARWRAAEDFFGLREGGETPPEKLLQAVWQHQRLRRPALRVLDGRRLRVLHPGFRNLEAGPDFRRAMIQLEDAPPVLGDIEVDQTPACWEGHRHHVNPAFQKVILHVVWDSREGNLLLPTLALKSFLDAPLAELAAWLGSDAEGELAAEWAGQCAPFLRELGAVQMEGLLGQAALARLQAKAAQIRDRARTAGWEQALWEAIFRALGYKHNVWPMQSLAELRERLADGCQSPLHWQARLLGTAGLLPGEISGARGSAAVYVRQLWDHWWRDRNQFGDCQLPPALWRLQGLRPANHPRRRLALAALWLAAGDLPARLERWFKINRPEKEHPAALLKALPAQDDFWGRHFTLRSSPLPAAQPLIGAPRITDLAVNVILPWLWARATEDNQPADARRAEAIYLRWPAGEDNAVLKQARQRLWGGSTAFRLRTAAMQQGLLQVIRDFCDHSDSLCRRCRFPEMVRQWSSHA